MELNDKQKIYISECLKRLEKSKFRSRFHLGVKEKDYTREKSLRVIENHCWDFINSRLALYPTNNDGKQTPMKGHPVFIAQHATATCCRGCLNKWYKIPKNRSLSDKEKRFIQALIISWIERELDI